MEQLIIKYLNQNMEVAKTFICDFKADVIGNEHYKLDYITEDNVFHYETKSYKEDNVKKTKIFFEYNKYKDTDFWASKKEIESVLINTTISNYANNLFMKLFNTVAKIHNVEKLLLDDYFYNIEPYEISIKYNKQHKLKILEIMYDTFYGKVRFYIEKKEVFKFNWNSKSGKKIPNSAVFFETCNIFLYKYDTNLVIDKEYYFNDMDEKLKEKLINIYLKYGL